MRTRQGWLVAVVAGLLGLASCSSGVDQVNPVPATPTVPNTPNATNRTTTTPTTAPSSTAPRFHATLLQYRPDEGTNRLEVELTNRSGRAVTVATIQLRWPGVRSAPRSRMDTSYAAGQTIDLTTTYGVAVCDGAEPSQSPRALAVLSDGTAVDIRLDQHGTDMLRRFRTRDCGLARLGAVVSFSLSPSFTVVHGAGPGHLLGSLVLQRPIAGSSPAGASVTVTDLTGSVLLDFLPAHALPIPLPDGVRRLQIPVTIKPGPRCDAHSLSQSTQTFLFSAYATIDGRGPQYRVILVPSDSVKAQAQALLERACR